MFKKCAVIIASGVMLANCATVARGTGQEVTVDSIPQGATCVLEREGSEIGLIQSTPGTVELSRSRQDINVTCNKAGYAPEITTLNALAASMLNNGWSAAYGLSMLTFWSWPSHAIDAATSAWYDYDNTLTVRLRPLDWTLAHFDKNGNLIFGHGADSCSNFLSLKTEDPQFADYVILHWVGGYLSAVNMWWIRARDQENGLIDLDYRKTSSPWLESYCASHPDERLSDAMEKFSLGLIQQGGVDSENVILGIGRNPCSDRQRVMDDVSLSRQSLSYSYWIDGFFSAMNVWHSRNNAEVGNIMKDSHVALHQMVSEYCSKNPAGAVQNAALNLATDLMLAKGTVF